MLEDFKKLVNKAKEWDGFTWVVVPSLYLEEFVKRTLIGVYHTWQKYDYWSHNRRVERDAKEAELNPPVLPKE